jgi:hypothetical protein
VAETEFLNEDLSVSIYTCRDCYIRIILDNSHEDVFSPISFEEAKKECEQFLSQCGMSDEDD